MSGGGAELEPLRALQALADARTPARLFRGRAGTSYTTASHLELRAAHAAARDAVHAALDLDGPELAPLVEAHGLFGVDSAATDHADHLLRPDHGRRLSEGAKATIAERCASGRTLQVVVGDGLSAAAVHTQVPELLPRVLAAADDRGWSCGTPFAVRHCRVGIMNDVGELLDPELVVLLVGERPGLGTAASLSAYVAHRPRPGDTDARRNLLSNIHPRGTPVPAAAGRLMALLEAILGAGASGVAVKEPEATAPALEGRGPSPR